MDFIVNAFTKYFNIRFLNVIHDENCIKKSFEFSSTYCFLN